MISRRDLIGALATAIGSSGLAGYAMGQRPRGKAARPMRAYHEIMEQVLKESHIVGATLAIAKDGRLVLARGYGLADANARRPVTPDTLFCIASVTKSITGVATLKLVDEGKVMLNARLVDVLDDIRPPDGRLGDPNFREITVRHVLQHSSGIPNRIRVKGNPRRRPEEQEEGEDEDDSADGDSNERGIELLRTAMAGQLDFAPGSRRSYSNSAFVIARLVIERASGKAYEPFVIDHILRPMGIMRAIMEKAEAAAEETCRYVLGVEGRRPAVRNVANWLFTSSDMVRFLTAVAGTRGQPFLKRPTFRAMVAPPSPPIKPGRGGSHVGLGWDGVVNTPQGPGFSKNGGKPGVSGWAQHRPDGVSWAFMINTNRLGAKQANNEKHPNAARVIRQRVNHELDGQKSWPDVDMFRA